MPLDFPASPTDGQIYGNWVYSTAKGAWKAKPLTPGQAQPSATAPTNPSNGDQWYNTIDGVLYIYYNDGNSSQWVESRSAITSDGYYSPNYIINGAFDIWQRGTTFTNIGTQTLHADRWKLTSSVLNGTVTQSTDVPSSAFKYSAQLSPYSNGTPGEFAMRQLFEMQHIRGIAGKTVTVSFWVKCSKTALKVRLEPYSATGATDTTLLASVDAGVWTRVQKTFTNFTGMSAWSAGDTSTGLSMDIGFADNTAMTTSDYLRITGVQLEEGPVATPFRRNANSLQGELAACQRYYWRSTPGTLYGVHPSTGVGINTTRSYQGVTHPVPMRITPTSVDWYNVGIHTPGIETFGLTSATILPSDSDNYVTTIDCYVSSGLTLRNVYHLSNNNSTSGYIGFNAEL